MCLKARWYATRAGRPDHGMVFLGITGTDGKSTTSACTYHILKQAGYRVGIISTVLIDIGAGLENNETHMTSLPHHLFWDYLSQAKAHGLQYMVIEDSSHSLRQYRTRPIRYMCVGITNLSREHLDFHWTMDHYARTKAELFGRLVEGGTGVVPYAYPYINTISHDATTDRVTFGVLDVVDGMGGEEGYIPDESPDICVSGITESPFLSFYLHICGQEPIHIDSRALGRFNTDNMMIASTLAQTVGCSITDIKHGLESFDGLPGRQELVQTQEGVTAMIDFALTPDALRTVYMASRGMGFLRLIVVFGATGNRDQGKRPQMGRVAAECADVVIVTEDENYHEDGMEIMRAIEGGILSARDEGSAYMSEDGVSMAYELVQDRRLAIRRGLELARPGDVVIVTGMANFTTRAMNEGEIEWDERGVIEEEMGKVGYVVK